MKQYLVGGAVRDQLMGLTPNDYDYVAVDSSHAEMLSHGYKQVGLDFPVYLNHEGNEIALARRERSTGPSYDAFITEISNVSLEEDLARRDLTINAIAWREGEGYVDPFNGQEDIIREIFRHTSEAFVEDPVRVLRVARLRARYGQKWRVAPETKALIYSMRSGLGALQPDRVWKELSRALMEPYPRVFFDTLFECGVLDVLFTPIFNLLTTREGSRYHREASVYEHTMMMLQLAADRGYPLVLRFAALYHDVAKPETYRAHGNSSGHDQIELIIPHLPEKIPAVLKSNTLLLVGNHTKIYKLQDMKPAKIATFLEQYKKSIMLLDYQLKLAHLDDDGRMADPGIKKEIYDTDVLYALQKIKDYSPKTWIAQQDVKPSGEAIKQHVHNYNTGIARKLKKEIT